MARGSVGKLEWIVDLTGKDKLTPVLDNLKGRIIGTDKASRKGAKGVSFLSGSFGGLTGEITNMIPGLGGVLESIKGLQGGAMRAAGSMGILGKALGAAGAVLALRGPAEQAAMLQTKLLTLNGTIGASAIKMRLLKQATQGTFATDAIVDAEAKIQAFNLPMQLTPELMMNIQQRATMMGVTTERAMDSLVTGIARQSVPWLDNIGIIINATEVYEKFGATLGKTGAQLTDSEKKAAFTAAAVEQLSGAASASSTPASDFQKIGASLLEIGMDLGSTLIPVFKVLRPVIEMVATAVKLAANAFNFFAGGVAAVAAPILEFVNQIAGSVGDLLTPSFEVLASLVARLGSQLVDFIVRDTAHVRRFIVEMQSFMGEHERMWVEWGIKAAEAMGIVNKKTAENMRLQAQQREIMRARKKAEAEKQAQLLKTQELEKQAAEAAKEAAKATEARLKVEKKREKLLRDGAIQILKMKDQTSGLTGEEEKRLKMLVAGAKVETLTGGLKAELITLTQEQVTLQETLNRLMADPFAAEGGLLAIQKTGVALAENKANIAAAKTQIQQIGALVAEAADAKKKPTGTSKKQRAADLNEQLAAARETEAQRIKEMRIKQQLMRIDAQKTDVQRKMLRVESEQGRAQLEIQLKNLEVQRLEVGTTNMLTEAKIRLLNAESKLIKEKLKEAEASAKLDQEQQKLTTNIAPLTAVAGQSAGAISGLAGVTATSAQVAHDAQKPNMDLSKAILASGPAYQDAAQQFVESEKSKALVAAAMQTAFGLATMFTEPHRAAAHFLAAAAFGAISMKKGSESSGGDDAGSGRLPSGGRLPSKSAEDQGPRSVVINFHGVVADPQSTAKQIGNLLASSRGTGR